MIKRFLLLASVLLAFSSPAFAGNDVANPGDVPFAATPGDLLCAGSDDNRQELVDCGTPVTSVFGRTGAISLTSSDITGAGGLISSALPALTNTGGGVWHFGDSDVWTGSATGASTITGFKYQGGSGAELFTFGAVGGGSGVSVQMDGSLFVGTSLSYDPFSTEAGSAGSLVVQNNGAFGGAVDINGALTTYSLETRSTGTFDYELQIKAGLSHVGFTQNTITCSACSTTPVLETMQDSLEVGGDGEGAGFWGGQYLNTNGTLYLNSNSSPYSNGMGTGENVEIGNSLTVDQNLTVKGTLTLDGTSGSIPSSMITGTVIFPGDYAVMTESGGFVDSGKTVKDSGPAYSFACNPQSVAAIYSDCTNLYVGATVTDASASNLTLYSTSSWSMQIPVERACRFNVSATYPTSAQDSGITTDSNSAQINLPCTANSSHSAQWFSCWTNFSVPLGLLVSPGSSIGLIESATDGQEKNESMVGHAIVCHGVMDL